MDEKLITIVLHYDGIFRRSGFSPGKTLPVAKEGVKRPFVTTHQLQQQQEKKKKANKKAPEPPRRILSPRQCKKQAAGTPEKKEPVVNKNSSARRKLNLHEDTDVEVPAQTTPTKNPYEERRNKQVLENREKFKELGLDKFLPNPNPPAVKINKEKDKVQEESDEYILENESEEEDSEDSSKSPKKKKIPPGPRFRSRANDANLCEKDPLHATRKKASKKVPAKEGVESSTAPKLLNPTCSKLLKQCGDIQSGFIAAYVALCERQKQNLELDPRIEDAGESSLPNEVEESEPGNQGGGYQVVAETSRPVLFRGRCFSSCKFSLRTSPSQGLPPYPTRIQNQSLEVPLTHPM
ncbi:hypothetical protein DCAR_0205481 [Daucus carota subsp. sativus]|uniref:Uncharacterized protein n=1 Tax=Daucus carota subsp. sativus TaxID=79200 RepID=A0AAF1AN91_DAUCS|nr:hypothetical protein DCAR_0205481 [Daucus carota subsp. sativus]